MQAQLNVNGVSCYLQAKHDNVLIERKRTMPKIIQSYDVLTFQLVPNNSDTFIVVFNIPKGSFEGMCLYVPMYTAHFLCQRPYMLDSCKVSIKLIIASSTN